MNKKTTNAYSRKMVIIFLILFFPVGLFLLYKRLSIDKQKNCNWFLVAGFLCVGLSVLFLFLGLTGQLKSESGRVYTVFDLLIMPLLFSVYAFVFLNAAQKIKEEVELYKKYINAIVNEKRRMIEGIASNVGVTYEKAINDLQKMIDCGHFPGAYIDRENSQFVLSANSNQTDKQEMTVVCNSCGASNSVVAGQAAQCKYCGTPIQTNKKTATVLIERTRFF